MSALPLISVVVASHNRAERLEALLSGLRAQTLDRELFEVVVVDDGSSDATQAVLEREHERGTLRLSYTRHPEPRGPAAARNRGWRLASGPVIAFTDDDCVPTPTWLQVLLAAAQQRDGAIVRGRTLPNPDETDALGPFSKTVEITRPSPHFETCNVAYPRTLLERVNGFDESFPSPAGEDSDLGARATAAGGLAHFCPDAVVHHAVFTRTPAQALRDALLATDDMRAYKANPELRRNLPQGVFHSRSHPLFLQAGLAAVLARRTPAAAVFCLPYALNLRGRCVATGMPLWQAPYFVAFDALQVAATVRGAVRHRLLVI